MPSPLASLFRPSTLNDDEAIDAWAQCPPWLRWCAATPDGVHASLGVIAAFYGKGAALLVVGGQAFGDVWTDAVLWWLAATVAGAALRSANALYWRVRRLTRGADPTGVTIG